MDSIKLREIEPLSSSYLESIGFTWHTDSDNSPYVSDKIVEISSLEAEAFYEAGSELYDMFVKAGDYVVENNLFEILDIPHNLIDMVKESWSNDLHWHLYGRFDLSGGVGGAPIKLIEFNADTPTSLFESAIIQWAILKYNKLEESLQFNSIYEDLRDNFKRVLILEDPLESFEEINDQTRFKILFSSIKDNIEEINTTKFLQHIAQEAGYECDFAYVDEVGFSEDGIFKDGIYYEFWFKLIPWESIALEEPELMDMLSNIITNQKGLFLNPAYTMMFQSKAMLKILWDLYPNHPLLLESSFEPLTGKKCVKKPTFGREGGNISILDSKGRIRASNDGHYGDFKSVYQEYIEFPKDSFGNFYQAGLFFSYHPCGLGFRRGGEILDNSSKFVGHIIKN